MTTCKIILTPTTKEPKICHALAKTSAFNLKLCLILFFLVEDPFKLHFSTLHCIKLLHCKALSCSILICSPLPHTQGTLCVFMLDK